jgi:hypothetical protein
MPDEYPPSQGGTGGTKNNNSANRDHGHELCLCLELEVEDLPGPTQVFLG